MNKSFESDDSNELAPPLQAALRATLSEPVPEDAVERVKLRARQLAQVETEVTSQTPSPLHPRRRISRSIVGSVVAVAAALVVMFGVTAWLDRSQGNAFAQVIAKVKAANTVQFAMAQRFGRQEEIKGRMYIDGSHYRAELFAGELVWISDVNTRQALSLQKSLKTAKQALMTPEMAKNFENPVDQLRNLKLADAERIGEEDVQGVRTAVYRVKNLGFMGLSGASDTIVWVDVKTQLPAKIVFRDTNPQHLFELRYDEFVWNEPLAAELFSLKVPEGYRLEAEPKSPPKDPPSSRPAPAIAIPTAHPDFVNGVISSDRVAGRIVLNRQDGTLTAVMRDPESTAVKSFWPHELRQWDLNTGKWRWKMEVAGAGWVAGSPDGKSLATVIGYEMQLRDAATGTVTRTWTTEKEVSPLAFSPDGKTLAAGIAEWVNGKEMPGGIQFWDVEHGTLLRTIPDDKPMAFVKYSIDGQFLVTTSNSSPVKVWNVNTGKLVRIFPGHFRADFSPDSKLIACPSGDQQADKTIGAVSLFNLSTGELVRTLTSEKGAAASYLLSIAFSPDGARLVATDWNGAVTLWDVATGDRIPTGVTHKAGVLVAEFGPNGATLVTGSEDKMLRLWKLPVGVNQPVEVKK